MQKVFLVSILGFTAGIAFRSFFDFGATFSYLFLLLGSSILFLYFLHRKDTLEPGSKVSLRGVIFLFVAIFIIATGFGMLRFSFGDNLERAHALNEYLGSATYIEGIVSAEPDIRATHTKLVVETKSVSKLVGETKSKNTKILAIVPHHPEFFYGDKVKIQGELHKPTKRIENEDEGGRPFNYRAYLAKDGVYYEMFYPKIERINSGEGNPLKRALFSMKRAYLKNLGRMLPEPHAALAGGITVGAKEALGDELLEIFRKTGIIHIVVLSGYNITIIARMIGRGATFLPRTAGLGISAGAIALFAIMTGAGATVVRASIMALLVLLARATGRVSEITTALLVAAFLMLLVNPKILVFDPSFQLSFLATVGLLFLAPRAEVFFKWLPERFGIREAASATIATQLFVMPFLVYLMGEFSIVSFLVNVLVLPLVPLSMLFSFLSGTLGLLHPLVSIPFSYIAWMFLEYSLSITEIFAALPLASISSISMPFWFVLVIYAVLFGCIAWRHR